MFIAEISDVRRLKLRTITFRGLDDLRALTPHTVSPEVATLAVRRLRRRGAVLVLLGLVMFIGVTVGASLLDSDSEELTKTGLRTSGVVVETASRTRWGAGSIEVRFRVDGVDRVRSVNLNDSSPPYQVNDKLTVIYDPANPDRIRTPEEKNDPTWATAPMIIAFVLFLFLVPSGSISLVRWSRRLQAAVRHGWRPGLARIHHNRSRAILDVRFSDRSDQHTVALATTRPVARPIPPEFTESEVLVSGSGRRMTVLFLQGPFLVSAKSVPGQPASD